MHSKGRKTGVIIGTVILLIAIIGGLIFFVISGRQKVEMPDKILERYVSLLSENKYKEMYGYLDENSRLNITEEEFIDKHTNIYSGIEAKDIQAAISEMDGEDKKEITVSYDMQMETLAGTLEFSNQAIFVLEENEQQEYKLVWNTRLIHPDLDSGDKIRVVKSESQRGTLKDRNGRLLAGEGEASSVGLVPGKMTDDTNLETLAGLLDTTAEAVQQKLDASWVNDESFVPIKTVRKPEHQPDDSISEAQQLEDRLLEIPGVLINTTQVRTYPLGKKAAHLTGYVQKVTAEDLEQDEEGVYHENSIIGKSGLEIILEERLRGIDGVSVFIEDRTGSRKKELAQIETRDGAEIVLTIDADIQAALYEQYQDEKSASVVMNPKTGEVLALLSTPAYDPQDFVFGLSEEKWNSLNEDEAKPLSNRYTSVWAPGSSFKPITGALGITAGKLDPDEDFGRSGKSWQKDESWGSYNITTLKEYEGATLKNALIYSDNIYFGKAALQIGADTFEQQLDKLGFNQTVPFTIGMRASSYANEGGIGSEVQLADSGYGQGEMLLNPLHLAVLYTGFVNDGSLIRPYLEYQDVPQSSYWLEDVYSAEAVSAVNEGMIQVFEHSDGAGNKMRREDVVLAGKTGTAEIKANQGDSSGTELGWFCAYTARSDGQEALLVLTMVEDVKDRGGSGVVVEGTKNDWEKIYKY